jgi:hypothetical protein
LLIDPETRKDLRVARTRDRAGAGDIEKTLHGSRIDVRAAAVHLQHAVDPVHRHAVTRAEDLHVVPLVRRRDRLDVDDAVLVVEIRVHHTDTGPVVARRAVAGVVEEDGDAVRVVIGDFHRGIHLAGLISRFEHHALLAHRVLVGELHVLADAPRVGRLAFLQRRQTIAHVLVVVEAVALDLDVADARLDHLDAHVTRADVLLGNQHAHRVVALRGVRILQGLDRLLDVAEIALLADVALDQRLHLLRGQQRVALQLEGNDVEAGRRHGRRRGLGERERAPK